MFASAPWRLVVVLSVKVHPVGRCARRSLRGRLYAAGAWQTALLAPCKLRRLRGQASSTLPKPGKTLAAARFCFLFFPLDVSKGKVSATR